MKKSIKAFALFVFLSTTSIYASYIKPNPNHVEIAGEWLYMLPSIDQGFLVGVLIQSETRHFAYKQEWQSGYRIEAIYNFCNCLNDIRFRWTQFPSFSLSKSASIPDVIATTEFPLPGANPLAQITPATVFTQAKFDFYYLDALFGQRVICTPCFTLGVHGGVQYVHLDLEENYVLIDPSVYFITWNSHMWGIGPEVDFECDYLIGNCFSITGRGFVSLLINDKLSKRDVVESGTSFKLENDRYWSIIPTMGLRFGLNYSQPLDLSCFCCLGSFNFEIEGGYEAILINRGIERVFEANLLSFNEEISFALHGPYLRVGVSF